MQKIQTLKEYPIQPKGWRKKYKCHKNKGDHNLVLLYVTKWTWWKPYTMHEYYECKACGKKSYKTVPW